VRKGGKIVNIAIYPNPVELMATSLVRRQVSLGVFASVWEDYEKAITLVSERRVDLNPLVTHKFSVTQVGAAFEAAKNREGCKVQLAM
jgi:threonine dehydrogenase-like Zn-dependent dehydrogenase